MTDEGILEKIYNSSLKFLFPLKREETYNLIVKEAMALTGADYGSLFLKRGRTLERVYATSESFYQIKNRPKGSMYQAYKENKIKILNVPFLSELHPVLRDLKVRSIIAAPLSNKGVKMGVIALQSREVEKFKSIEFSLLQFFTPLATMAIRKMELYEQVTEALKTRDLFISMAAHELRTPLTAINGYIQLLHRRLKDQGTSESRWVDQLWHESIRLTNLVNELLEINRIKSGQLKYDLQECHLSEIVENVKNEFSFSHPDREITIENELNQNDVVTGDYGKITQVVTNLLENAIKFSSPNSRVKVTLSPKGTYHSIMVEDKGIGINKKDIKRIFEGFQQGEGHTKEGMGLGLFLVKDIVLRLQGKIRVRSRVHKGTKFEILLPKLKYEQRKSA